MQVLVGANEKLKTFEVTCLFCNADCISHLLLSCHINPYPICLSGIRFKLLAIFACLTLSLVQA